MKKKPKLKEFTVWVDQVNQQRFTVKATNREDAVEKGYSKWRREYGHSRVSCVEPALDSENVPVLRQPIETSTTQENDR